VLNGTASHLETVIGTIRVANAGRGNVGSFTGVLNVTGALNSIGVQDLQADLPLRGSAEVTVKQLGDIAGGSGNRRYLRLASLVQFERRNETEIAEVDFDCFIERGCAP
jgi:hypothetical protein